MAVTNHERVGKALELLKAGLGPFVDREVKGALESRRLDAFKLRDYAGDPVLAKKPTAEWDVAGLLKLMMGDLERRLSQDSRAGGAGSPLVSCAATATSGLTRRASPAMTLTGHWTRQAGSSSRYRRRSRMSLRGSKMELLRVRFRRADARGTAKAGGHRDRKRCRGRPQAVAGDRHASQGRCERAVPASGICGRPSGRCILAKGRMSTGIRSSSFDGPT